MVAIGERSTTVTLSCEWVMVVWIRPLARHYVGEGPVVYITGNLIIEGVCCTRWYVILVYNILQ